MAGTPEKTTGTAAAVSGWSVDFPIYGVTELIKLILNVDMDCKICEICRLNQVKMNLMTIYKLCIISRKIL